MEDEERKLTDQIDDLLSGINFPHTLNKLLWDRRYNKALDELNGMIRRLCDVRASLVPIIENQRRDYNRDTVPYFSELQKIPMYVDWNHKGPWDYEETP